MTKSGKKHSYCINNRLLLKIEKRDFKVINIIN